MTKIPQPIHSIAALIDASHETRTESPRGHLGCSLLGHPCERWLWLSFRWAVKEQFPGRILRLFRRGHNEEATIIKDLEAIGVKFSSHQEHVDLGSHVGLLTAPLRAASSAQKKLATFPNLRPTLKNHSTTF